MGLTILMYSLAVLVVGVIALAFYTTVQTYKLKQRELELQHMELQSKGATRETIAGSTS